MFARAQAAREIGRRPARCPCGGRVDRGGECDRCRARRLGGHAPAVASFAAPIRGGETVGQEPAKTPPKAPAPVPAPAPTPAPAPKPAAPAAPSLTKSEVTPRTDDGCGGYHWAIKWDLANATAETNGFVVQQVTVNHKHTHCQMGRVDTFRRYWEGWQVRGGKIYAGLSKQPHEQDEFVNGPDTDFKGMSSQEGKAKFIPGYDEPLKWGHVHEARGLPATESEPAGWSSEGTIERDIKSWFDCCGKTPNSKVEGSG